MHRVCLLAGREICGGRLMTQVSDRNLLLGLLALRLGCVDRDSLLGTLREMSRAPQSSLTAHWAQCGALAPSELTVLDQAVDRYLAKHGDLAGSAAALEAGLSLEQLVRDLAAAGLGMGSADASDAFRTRAVATEKLAGAGPEGAGSTGRFQILRPHASGGLGEVFIARDRELNRDVALKEIHARLVDNEEVRARFLLEAEITGGLEHPGIVPVYGKGQDATGRPFYAMRFIRGRSMRDAIRELHDESGQAAAPGAWRLGLRRLLSALIDVCNAVAYAHSRGILHRDLKPENVMLGRYGETLLVDWGLAKLMGQTEASRPPDASPDMSVVSLLRPEAASGSTPTRHGAVVGTPTYMSPEQAAGLVGRLGITSDVYSLGATLYVLLTGCAPFEAQTAEDIRLAVLAGRFPPPRQVNRRVPRPLEAICLKAMQLDPQQRYPSAEELAADIEKWMADEPVAAWREPLALRAARWMRRHRTPVAGAASAVLVAVVSLLATVALLAAANERERHAREVAVANEQDAQRNLQRAVEQEQRAQQNFQMAREAVDTYLTQVSDDIDLKSHNLETLRRKLLETARGFYARFVDEKPQEPALQADWAAANMRLAKITAETGSKADAVALGEQALHTYERLAANSTGRTDDPLEALRVRVALGTWQRDVGQTDAARTMLETSATAVQQQLTLAPQSRELREVLSDAQRNLGLLEVRTQRREQAETWLLAAIDTGKQLADDVPEEPAYRCQLSESYLELALLYQQMSRFDDALAQLNNAYQIQQALVDKDRSVAHNVSVLVRIADAIVALYNQWTGQRDQSEPLQLTALDLHQTLASEHPGVLEYQQGLARSHANLAQLYMGKGNYFVAEPHLQSARGIFEKLVSLEPDAATNRSELGAVLMNLGLSLSQCARPDDALKALESAAGVRRDLVAKYPDDAQYRYALAATCNELGRFYSMASRWDESGKALGEASGLAERLVRDHADNAEYRTELAMITYNLGELDMSRNEPSDALDRFVAAGQILQPQAEAAEASSLPCVLLRNSWFGQARALCQLRRCDDAQQAWQQAVDMDGRCEKNSLHDLLFVWRSELLVRANDPAAAGAVVDELAAAAAHDGTRLHNFALLYTGRLGALESDKSLEADEQERLTRFLVDTAITFLRHAHTAGFFQSPWQINFLQIDQRLQPLQNREEFKKLMEELTVSK
jgi:eukaryotic-like serine/threonine-protein kinase